MTGISLTGIIITTQIQLSELPSCAAERNAVCLTFTPSAPLLSDASPQAAVSEYRRLQKQNFQELFYSQCNMQVKQG